MACYHPLNAYQCADGGIVFYEHRRFDIVRELQLPCGQCIGCRLERSRQWAMRCLHESSLYQHNSFVTLTYEDAKDQTKDSLQYTHFQGFMKRLRWHNREKQISFYMCGEYGELRGRPHYHALLFNHDWEDKEYYKQTNTGFPTYTSEDLEKLWGYGQCVTAEVNFETAAYTARYCMKKITGAMADFVYEKQEDGKYKYTPEFNKMSLNPAIGKRWLNKWQMDVYPHDYVVINGKECRPPKYYDELYERENELIFDQIKQDRISLAYDRREDNTPERLKAKEEVQNARIKKLKRII